MNDVKSRQEIFDILNRYFGSSKKTFDWLQTLNPNLGCEPMKLIRKGQSKKLLTYIKGALVYGRL